MPAKEQNIIAKNIFDSIEFDKLIEKNTRAFDPLRKKAMKQFTGKTLANMDDL